MIWFACFIIAAFINTFIITTIVDIAVMGSYTLRLSGTCGLSQYQSLSIAAKKCIIEK